MSGFNLNHLYEAQQLHLDILEVIFKTATSMKEDLAGQRHYADALRGRIMASLFYEPSTRTRFSFESAMHRLGGCIITTENAREFSSAAKGESLSDTIRIMNGYADIIVLRHYEGGSAKVAAGISDIPIINAGDGAGQHPTQALLDLYTLQDKFDVVNGIKIAMVGDLKYGRTVRSLSYLLAKFNRVRIYFVAPQVCRMDDDIKDYLDRHDTPWQEEPVLENILPEVDCVYMTRVQKERFVDPEQYDKIKDDYILTPDKVSLMNERAIIMHPLPRVNEIPLEVDDDHRSRYFEQARNGLFVRMALLYLLLNR